MQQLVRMFPDIRVHTPYPIQFGDRDWITVVTNVTGTFTGEMTMPDGNVIPPTGRAFDVEFAQTSKWTATSSSSSPPSGTPRYRPSSSDSRGNQRRRLVSTRDLAFRARKLGGATMWGSDYVGER
jgi:hypothetical protein